MLSYTFRTQASPDVIIQQCQGDLQVAGWSSDEVVVATSGSASDLQARQTENQVEIVCLDDLEVQVPGEARLQVRQVQGDMSLEDVAGAIQIDTVQGDLAAHDLGEVRIKYVRGDLSIRDVTGSLTLGSISGDMSVYEVDGGLAVQQVHGDMRVREVAGPVQIGSVSGDLATSNVDGLLSVGSVRGDLAVRGGETGVRAESVSGDASLRTAFRPGAEYLVRARGDVVCKIPAGTVARFTLRAGGDVQVQIPGARVEHPSQHEVVIWVGDGSEVAQVELEAGGDLVLRPEEGGWAGEFDFNVSFEGMGKHFDRLDTQLKDMDRRLRETLGRINVDVGPLGERVQQQVERAAEKARRKAERAAARAERHVNWSAPAGGRSTPGAWAAGRQPPTPPPPPPSPATEAERLAVLQMVAEGKISAQEADMLLRALES